MIRVLVPDMPLAEELLPYLRQMDHSKSYVNNGPLVKALEDHLGHLCGVPVVTVSNGTAALELALQSLETSHCSAIMPALTFAATGLAAKRNGFGVDLADVEVTTWQIPPGLAFDRNNLSVVLPVATFGRPVDPSQWLNYDVPVIIDAAGALLMQACSEDPNIATCFSLHATKFIGAGEGGFVACADENRLNAIRELAQFGLDGTNAKMSEYHAAVALASLERREAKSFRTQTIRRWYKEHGIQEFKHYSNRYSTMLTVQITHAMRNLPALMARRGVEIRQWYRPWLDERADFSYEGPLQVTTEYLRDRLFGLPFHNFLTEADVAHVMASLREVQNEDRA